jgi:hypothetical protein
MRGNKMFNPSTWLNKNRKLQQVRRSRRSWVVASGCDMRNHTCEMHPEAQQVVEMKPEEFLYYTAPHPQYYEEWVDQQYTNFPEKQAKLENRLENDLALDPAWLVVDIDDDYRVVRHEGRHRAMAADRLGIEYIPVVLFIKRGRRYVNLAEHPEDRVDIDHVWFTPQYEGREPYARK